jgi:hypothetical protein
MLTNYGDVMEIIVVVTIIALICGYSFLTVMSWWMYLLAIIIGGFLLFILLAIIFGLCGSFDS